MSAVQIRRKPKRAFTLVELLVVLVLIALLAAILFPVLAQAREKARSATCASNLKNLGLAMMLYVQDHDETYPSVWYPPIGHWANVIRPYMGQGGEGPDALWTKGIMVCPSAAMWGWSYAMSNELNVYDPILGAPRGRATAELARPAAALMLAEAPQVTVWASCAAHLDTRAECWGGRTGDGLGGDGYEDRDGVMNGRCFSLPRYRHHGGALIAWADGHASWKRKGLLRWCRDISIQEPGSDCPP